MAPWFFLTGTLALMLLLGAGTVYSGLALRSWTPDRNLLLTWPDNLVRLVLVALCLVLGAAVGPGAAALGWSTESLGADLIVGGAVGLLMATGLNAAGAAAQKAWGPAIYDSKLLRCMLPAERWEWPGVLAALLPAAALEELLFRSLPLAGLTWLAPAWLLVTVVSLLFAALHWPQGAWGVVGTAMAGIVLSLLFLLTGSIWASIVAHYVMNVVQLLWSRQTGLVPLRAEPGSSARRAGGAVS